MKEVKFRVNIDEHDYLTKIRHAEEFLDKGNKVKIHLQFRGREMAHQELGMEVVHRVKNDLTTMGHVDMEPKLVGKAIGMTLSPLPVGKRKRKFSKAGDDLEPEPIEIRCRRVDAGCSSSISTARLSPPEGPGRAR